MTTEADAGSMADELAPAVARLLAAELGDPHISAQDPADAYGRLRPALREQGFLPSKQGFHLPRRARDGILQLPAAEPEEPSLDDEAQDA